MKKHGIILLAVIIALSQISCRVPDVIRSLPSSIKVTNNPIDVEAMQNPAKNPDMVPMSNTPFPQETGQRLPVNPIVISPVPGRINPVSDNVTPEKDIASILNPAVKVPQSEDTVDKWMLTLAVIPDTQFLSETNPNTFNAITRWITENWGKEKFDFVAHLGDLVNVPDSEPQWQRAAFAMSLLGNHPFTVLPGNHDFISDQTGNFDYSLFNKYFSPNSLSSFANTGNYPSGTLINSYVEVKGYLILSVGFFYSNDLRPSTKEWIKTVMTNHPDRPVILVTHDFLKTTGELSVSGKTLWDVIQDYPNVFLVLSGHAWTADDVNRQQKVLTLKGTKGNVVNAIMSNYQEFMARNSGFFRIYRISQDAIEVKTYSPLYGYMMDNESRFSLSR